MLSLRVLKESEHRMLCGVCMTFSVFQLAGRGHGIIPSPSWKPFQFSSVQFSCSKMSDSLRPHELQHPRPPCPSPSPGVHSNSHPLSRWCHPAISSSVLPLLLLSPIPPSIRVFSNESILRMRWPKYWSFSVSIIPSKEHPGLKTL